MDNRAARDFRERPRVAVSHLAPPPQDEPVTLLDGACGLAADYHSLAADGCKRRFLRGASAVGGRASPQSSCRPLVRCGPPTLPPLETAGQAPIGPPTRPRSRGQAPAENRGA